MGPRPIPPLKTEIPAGATTFMAMAYITLVNPAILAVFRAFFASTWPAPFAPRCCR